MLHDLRRRFEAVTVGDGLRGPGDSVRQRIEAPRHVIAERRRLTVTPRLRRAQSAVVVAIAHHVRRRAERALIEYAHPVESVIGVARLPIGRAHLRTPVTNAHLECRCYIDKQTYLTNTRHTPLR